MDERQIFYQLLANAEKINCPPYPEATHFFDSIKGKASSDLIQKVYGNTHISQHNVNKASAWIDQVIKHGKAR